MSFKRWLQAGATTIISLALSTSISFAQEEHGHGHEKHERDDDGRDRDHGHGEYREHERTEGRGHGHDRYSDHDRDAARGWYRDHYSHLPPGLAKRDRLPPGLERRLVVRGFLPVDLRRQMRPCPHELEVMLPPAPPHYAHVVIGGNLVLVNRANFQIADVFHFDIH